MGKTSHAQMVQSSGSMVAVAPSRRQTLTRSASFTISPSTTLTARRSSIVPHTIRTMAARDTQELRQKLTTSQVANCRWPSSTLTRLAQEAFKVAVLVALLLVALRPPRGRRPSHFRSLVSACLLPTWQRLSEPHTPLCSSQPLAVFAADLAGAAGAQCEGFCGSTTTLVDGIMFLKQVGGLGIATPLLHLSNQIYKP